VSIWPKADTVLYLADASAIKVSPVVCTPSIPHLRCTLAIQKVSLSRSRFPKPVQYYSFLTFFGRNILASEGDEWKKYRKIVAPAFSDVSITCYALFQHPRLMMFATFKRNNRLVWEESIKIVQDMFETVWENKKEIIVDDCADITLPVTITHFSCFRC
jgi:hypothetical protein